MKIRLNFTSKRYNKIDNLRLHVYTMFVKRCKILRDIVLERLLSRRGSEMSVKDLSEKIGY